MRHLELQARPWRERDADARMAWRPPTDSAAGWISVGAWRQRIGAWQALLASHTDGSGAWLLFDPDPLEFSAALVAIWERGEQAILPADDQPATLAALRDSGQPLGTLTGGVRAGADRDPEWSHRPLPAIAVTLYTSGSTGEPQRLDKRFAQLDAELATQHRLWPYTEDLVIGQVSHQHIYGLLFLILRPLSEGVPLATRPCPYPETLHAWLAACAEAQLQAALVSAPPALSRLPATLDWAAVHAAQGRIYSSGAPLSSAASDLALALLGSPVHEVYGSSETGGIAWRVQQQGETWRPFPGLAIESDSEQRLWLRSPHLAEPQTWQRQADRIALEPNGGFRLLGRADRIVKIGGKRLSLTAMDRALGELEGVHRAQTVTLNRRELRLGAIVELDANHLPHDHASHRATVKRLRRALAERFETPALPRYWRFVETWPTNAQGKLTATLRERLFADLDDRRAPRWLGERALEDGIEVTLEVPEHCRYVDGHFDAQPVVPGVTLVHWAIQLARRLFALEADFTGLERLRFPQPLLPGDRFRLTLARRRIKESESLMITCESARGQHASGRLTLTERHHVA